MGIEVALLVGTAVNLIGQIEAADAQKKIQGEQRASNAREQALERRQQVREARIRQAQILQASQNTGVSVGSGVEGAQSSISTNLESNIGVNLGRKESANNISIFQQDIANAQTLSAFGSALASVGSVLSKKQ